MKEIKKILNGMLNLIMNNGFSPTCGEDLNCFGEGCHDCHDFDICATEKDNIQNAEDISKLINKLK